MPTACADLIHAAAACHIDFNAAAELRGHRMYIAGVDGCRAGWVAFRVDLASRATTVQVPLDLSPLLRRRPEDLCAMAVDVPIGLLDRPRRFDQAGRALLGQPRGWSVFSPPCRAALQAGTYEQACATNRQRTGMSLSR
jgi:predicted RNase H-like nuclease